jgi:hypothetical protein
VLTFAVHNRTLHTGGPAADGSNSTSNSGSDDDSAQGDVDGGADYIGDLEVDTTGSAADQMQGECLISVYVVTHARQRSACACVCARVCVQQMLCSDANAYVRACALRCSVQTSRRASALCANWRTLSRLVSDSMIC